MTEGHKFVPEIPFTVGGGSASGGGSSTDKLTTSDVFSDFRVSGCIPSVPGGVSSHNITGKKIVPNAWAVSSDGAYVFTGGQKTSDNTPQVIKAATADGSVAATFDMPSSGEAAFIFVSGSFVYVLDWVNDLVYKLNASDLTEVTHVATGVAGGYNAAISGDGADLFVVNGSTTVGIVALPALTASTITVAQAANFVAVDQASGNHIWVDDTSGLNFTVSLYTFAGGAAVTSIDSGVAVASVAANAMAHSDAQRVLAVTDNSAGGVLLFDTNGGTLIGNVSAGGKFPAIQGAMYGANFYASFNGGGHGYVGIFPLDGSAASFVDVAAGSIYPLAADSSGTIYTSQAGNPINIIVDAVSGLTATMPSGVAYVSGTRVTPSSESHAFTASKDTYVSVNSSGTYLFNAVNNGAGQPAITGLLLCKVVTDGSAITDVVVLAPVKPATGPQVIHVTGDYTVVPGGSQFLVIDAPATITLPPSLSSAGTVVTLFNDASNAVSIAFAGAGDYLLAGGFLNYSGQIMSNTQDCIQITAVTDSVGDYFWAGVGSTGAMLATPDTIQVFKPLVILPSTAPSNPASGWVFYVDSGDGHLKAKKSDGTTVDLTP